MRPAPYPVDEPATQRGPEPRTQASPVEHARQDEAPSNASSAAGSRGRESSRVALERMQGAGALWSVLGGLLLLVGVITFFRFLAAAQVAGGCCGGGLVVLAGVIFLVIGVRDRGEFTL